jgi:hypothetical protein
MSEFSLAVAHLANNGCGGHGPGDTNVGRWSDVTCAACIALMPSTADNGCRHERMVWVGRERCPMNGRVLNSEAWQCPCGFKQSRLVSTASLLADVARVVSNAQSLVGAV